MRSDEIPRVVIRHPTFADLLDLAVSQPRRYGAHDPAVLARLFMLLREVAWSAPKFEQRSAITDQLARLRRTTADQNLDNSERRDLAAMSADVEAALAGRVRFTGQ